MSNMLRDLGLKNQLRLAALLLLLLVSLFIVWYFPLNQRRQMREDLETKARVIASIAAQSVAVGLVFDDSDSATSELTVVDRSPDVRFALVFDGNDELFAEYAPESYEPYLDKAMNLFGDIEEDGDFADTEQESRLLVVTPVWHEGQRQGTLVLGVDLQPLRDNVWRSQRAGLIVGLIITALGFVVFSVLASILVSKLETAVGVAEHLARGDLTVEIKDTGKNETGQLLAAMQTMVGSFRKILSQILDTAQSVSSSAEEISSSAVHIAKGAENQSSATEETSSTMVEMAAQIANLARNAEVLAESVEQTSAAMEQMNATLDQTAANGEVMLASVDETTLTLQEMSRSIEAVSSSVQAVDEVSRASVDDVRKAGERLQSSIDSIEKRSGEIGEIVKVIEGIADQTNLLSLNAAIEAARAGEAGKGFAVVAEEVKRLADRSASATQEIESLIESVQDATGTVVEITDEVVRDIIDSIERTAGLAEEAAQVSQDQADAASRLLTTASKMSDLAHQIAEAAKENAVGAGEITRATDKMNQLTKQMLDATVEQKQGGDLVVKAVDSIALVARQHLSAVGEMSTASQHLVEQSESLKKEVQTFSI